METASPTALLIEDQVWRKKRGFWIWNVAISASLMVLVPLTVLLFGLFGMKGAFGSLGTSGADVGALSNHIGQVMLSTAISMGFSAIAFIWTVVAIVRLCTLPKPPVIVGSVR
jgi:hypothetical protein